jgi:hypothetical protein
MISGLTETGYRIEERPATEMQKGGYRTFPKHLFEQIKWARVNRVEIACQSNDTNGRTSDV